jgi:tRNA-dihydrouridine synthase B
VAIPVIANGDIESPEKAKKVLELTGADAIMIGRAAQGRPWIFREIDHYLMTGEKHSAPQPAWIRDILLEHLGNLYTFYGEFQGVRIARKHIAWYSRTQPGGALFRQRINTTDSTEKQQALIVEFFDQLAINKERAA